MFVNYKLISVAMPHQCCHLANSAKTAKAAGDFLNTGNGHQPPTLLYLHKLHSIDPNAGTALHSRHEAVILIGFALVILASQLLSTVRR